MTSSQLREPKRHGQPSSYARNLKATILASEWGSDMGGLSTFSRHFAIQLAKLPGVKVSYFVLQCSEKDRKAARRKNIEIVEAEELPGYDELDWLTFPPKELEIDVVFGHGVKLGHQAQVIRKSHGCKWIQVVHTDPEKLAMYKSYQNPISTGEIKHETEVALCAKADIVVGVGPKLCESFRGYLRSYKKNDILEITPGVFDELLNIEHVEEDGKQCIVLVFGRGDAEDFELKGFDIAGRAVSEVEGACLIFVGAPKEKHEEIAERFRRSGVPKNRFTVRSFVRDREHLKRLFCEVDLVLMPSRSEGFGLTGLEALSAGLPVLVSSNSGFGEALSKVPYGKSCVIGSEDHKEWAEEIKKIWKKDRQTRLQEADRLRTSYREKYNWARQCKELLSLVDAETKMATGQQDERMLTETKMVTDQQDERILAKTKMAPGQQDEMIVAKTKMAPDQQNKRILAKTQMATDQQDERMITKTKMAPDQQDERILVKTKMVTDQQDEMVLAKTKMVTDQQDERMLTKTKMATDHQDERMLTKIKMATDQQDERILAKTKMATDQRDEMILAKTKMATDRRDERITAKTQMATYQQVKRILLKPKMATDRLVKKDSPKTQVAPDWQEERISAKIKMATDRQDEKSLTKTKMATDRRVERILPKTKMATDRQVKGTGEKLNTDRHDKMISAKTKMANDPQVERILKTSMHPYLEGFNDWVLMPTRFKVACYWFIILVGSFIHDFLPLPQSYFSHKKNVFNVYFVKLGWGWTLLLLIPFISLTSSVYTSLNPSAMLRHISRMAIATCGWYFWVNLFVYIEEKTGHCEGEKTLISRRSCYQEGFHWNCFDISGHCFLLIYSALVISEELQPKLYWSSRTSAFEQTGPEDINGFQYKNIALVTPFVEVLFFFAGLLSILWEFMLICTTVCFHTVYQKVLGALIAMFTWYITYRVWYHHELSPGRPWVPKS